MTGVVFWIACGAIPCLHKALGRNSLCTTTEIADSDLIRTSLPLRSDAELPPWHISLLCFLASPQRAHSVCPLPQQDDNRLLYVRRLDGNDFKIFDRPAVTAMKNVNAACTEQRMRVPKLRRFVRNRRTEVERRKPRGFELGSPISAIHIEPRLPSSPLDGAILHLVFCDCPLSPGCQSTSFSPLQAVDLIQNRERQGASRRFLPVFFKQSPAASALPLTKSTACLPGGEGHGKR